VYKVKVFGVGVLEEKTRRTRWERLPPQTKDRVMQKANIEMHVMMKTAQKGLKKVKRQLAEQEARGRQRQEAALARMEQRHARTVQIEVWAFPFARPPSVSPRCGPLPLPLP